MATAADWEVRFCEFVRVSPRDGRGIWALIVECLDDDDALTHTINSVLRKHHVPCKELDDWRQELAKRLALNINSHPDLNLSHRRTEVPANVWFYDVIDHLCRDMLRGSHEKKMRRVNLDAVLVDGKIEGVEDDVVCGRGTVLEIAAQAQVAHEQAIDTTFDVEDALRACDPDTAALILAFAQDTSVQSVANELGIEYMHAWRAIRKALRTLRRTLRAYENN